MSCYQHSDCPGYGLCKNGKCEYPLQGSGPSACESSYDCGHLGTCVAGKCDYWAAQPYNDGMPNLMEYTTNVPPSSGPLGFGVSRSQRRAARNEMLRGRNPLELKDPWGGASQTQAPYLSGGASVQGPCGGDDVLVCKKTGPSTYRCRCHGELNGYKWSYDPVFDEPTTTGSLAIGGASPPPPHPVGSLSARQRRAARNDMLRSSGRY